MVLVKFIKCERNALDDFRKKPHSKLNVVPCRHRVFPRRSGARLLFHRARRLSVGDLVDHGIVALAVRFGIREQSRKKQPHKKRINVWGGGLEKEEGAEDLLVAVG